MCSRVAISQQGFRKAAEHLHHLAQIRISHERLRMIVEDEGQKVLQAQSKGQMETSVTLEKCKTAPDGPTRVYIGVDGVKVPMVTTEEKVKRRKKRGPKRKALQELISYISKRIGQCDYPRYVSQGWQIGSGPTEAMCKVLTYRLKGSGMRWDRQGAEPIMALIALEQSNVWQSYWQSQNLAA